MKLIEKMGKEYGKKVVEEDAPKSDWVNISYDWQEGFRAAREMAACAVEEVDPHLPDDEQRIWIRKYIVNLGEEEVE
jgi:hypothetical protein